MGKEWEGPFEVFLTYYEERHPDYVRPFPGVHQLLLWLGEQRARRGVVTGKGARTAAVTLRLLGLADYFDVVEADRKSTRLNSSHVEISYAVFCLKKKTLQWSGGVTIRKQPAPIKV